MDGLAVSARIAPEPPLPRNLGRAVRYLRDNLREPLTLAMLVEASGLTERTLHKQFRRFLGMTPLAYLRRLRLLAAYEALSRPAGPGVSEVAFAVGFAHLGRFSIHFRAEFGEAPSVTRRRAVARATMGSMLSPPGYVRPVIAVAASRAATLAERRQSADMCEHLAMVLAQAHAFTVRVLAQEHDGVVRSSDSARYCLAVRVAHNGVRARIGLALTDRQTNRHLWGDSFNGFVGEPFVLQDAAVKGLLSGVAPALAEAEFVRLTALPKAELDAHSLALRALPLAFAASVPSARRLIAAMAQPMEMDPGAALPVALMALGLAQMANYFGSEDPDALRIRARELYLRAAELDRGDPLVTTARAATASLSYWMEDADALAERGVAMDPTNHWGWERRGLHCLRADGLADAALADLERALRLKPSSMPRANTLLNIATAHRLAGRPQQAIPFTSAALSESPADWMRLSLVWRHAWAGERQQARSALDDLRRAIPHLTRDQVIRTLKGLQPDWLERLVYAGLPS
jgi:AraC-like DNA-binding protein